MKQLLLLLSLPMFALAQDQARIVGTISDSSGAVLSKATVTVTDDKTSSKRQVTADERGLYIITNLAPSTYTLVATSPSLAPSEIKSVPLSVGQERTVDLVLTPASVATEVTVSGGELTTVDTSSAAIGATVNAREVGTLPLNGRQLSQLY